MIKKKKEKLEKLEKSEKHEKKKKSDNKKGIIEKWKNKKHGFDPNSVNIPPLVWNCCEYLNKKGIKTVGIFRTSVPKSELQSLKDKIKKNESYDFHNYKNPHHVASILSEFLRNPVDPILTKALYDAFIVGTNFPGSDDIKIQLTKQVLEQLPRPNFMIAKKVLETLYLIHSSSNENKMDATNLSKVIGPSLLRTGDVNPTQDMLNDYLRDIKQQTLAAEFLISFFPILFNEEVADSNEQYNIKKRKKTFTSTQTTMNLSADEEEDLNLYFTSALIRGTFSLAAAKIQLRIQENEIDRIAEERGINPEDVTLEILVEAYEEREKTILGTTQKMELTKLVWKDSLIVDQEFIKRRRRNSLTIPADLDMHHTEKKKKPKIKCENNAPYEESQEEIQTEISGSKDDIRDSAGTPKKKVKKKLKKRSKSLRIPKIDEMDSLDLKPLNLLNEQLIAETNIESNDSVAISPSLELYLVEEQKKEIESKGSNKELQIIENSSNLETIEVPRESAIINEEKSGAFDSPMPKAPKENSKKMSRSPSMPSLFEEDNEKKITISRTNSSKDFESFFALKDTGKSPIVVKESIQVLKKNLEEGNGLVGKLLALSGQDAVEEFLDESGNNQTELNKITGLLTSTIHVFSYDKGTSKKWKRVMEQSVPETKYSNKEEEEGEESIEVIAMDEIERKKESGLNESLDSPNNKIDVDDQPNLCSETDKKPIEQNIKNVEKNHSFKKFDPSLSCPSTVFDQPEILDVKTKILRMSSFERGENKHQVRKVYPVKKVVLERWKFDSNQTHPKETKNEETKVRVGTIIKKWEDYFTQEE